MGKDLTVVKGYIKYSNEEFKIASSEKRVIEGYFSTKDLDRVDDIVLPTAFSKSLPDFVEKNGVVLFNHNYDWPVGKIVAYNIDEKGAFVRVEIAKGTEKADEVWNLIKQGVLKTFSFGFVPKEVDTKVEEDGKTIRVIKDVDLLEVSVVSVPANTEATFEVVAGKAIKVILPDERKDVSFSDGKENKDVSDEEKATPPFKDFPLASKSRPWDKTSAIARVRKWASSDGSGDKDKINWSKYKLAFFWYDENDPENFSSYKLPFVDIIDGEPHAVPRGVIAAAAAVQGARGGVNIPEKDLPAVKRHIAKYYKKMGMTPPWDKKGEFDDFELLVIMEENIKEHIDDVMEDIADYVFEKLAEIEDKVMKIGETVDKILNNLIERKSDNVNDSDSEVYIDEEKVLAEVESALKDILETIKERK